MRYGDVGKHLSMTVLTCGADFQPIATTTCGAENNDRVQFVGRRPIFRVEENKSPKRNKCKFIARMADIPITSLQDPSMHAEVSSQIQARLTAQRTRSDPPSKFDFSATASTPELHLVVDLSASCCSGCHCLSAWERLANRRAPTTENSWERGEGTHREGSSWWIVRLEKRSKPWVSAVLVSSGVCEYASIRTPSNLSSSSLEHVGLVWPPHYSFNLLC